MDNLSAIECRIEKFLSINFKYSDNSIEKSLDDYILYSTMAERKELIEDITHYVNTEDISMSRKNDFIFFSTVINFKEKRIDGVNWLTKYVLTKLKKHT